MNRLKSFSSISKDEIAAIVRRVAPSLFIAIIFVVAVIANWSGIGPGDAERYIGPALRWAEGGAYLGDTHWALRLPFVLPMAAAFKTLGVSEFSSALPNLIYAAGLIAITFWFGRRYLGSFAGMAAAGFIATSAYFVVRPLEVEVYGAEAFFAALSAWLYIASEFEKRRFLWLIGCGAAAGFAAAVREQVIYLIAVFGVLTLIRRKDVIKSGLALSLGFGAVIMAEMLFYALQSGDFFYRYKIDLGHRAIGQNVEFKGADAAMSARLLRPIKDLLSYAAMTPFLAVALVLAIKPGWRIWMTTQERRRSIVIFWTLSAVAVPVCSYIFNLSFARYYPILAYTAFLMIGVGAAEIWRVHGRLAGIGFALFIALLNAAAADFSKYNEYAEVRLLADLAEKSEEPITTDMMTAFRARYQLVLRGYDSDVAAQMVIGGHIPAEGSLFFKSFATQKIDPMWCVLKSAEARPPNWTHAVIRVLKIDSIVGGRAREIVAPAAAVKLVRVSGHVQEFDSVFGAPCLNYKPE